MGAQASAAQDALEPRPLSRWFMLPWVDKTLAIIAVLPFVYPIALRFRQHTDIWETIYLLQTLLIIATMVFRRIPVRITANPYYWILAVVASYWGLLILSVGQPGRSLVAPWVLLPVYPISIFIDIWGRLSLGRNIGVLPAQRQIVDRGAYRWVRHPIYTAAILLIIAGMLTSYSLQNLLLYSLGIFWFVARTFAEEEFLRKDPAYSAYMDRVRWRWFPGLT